MVRRFPNSALDVAPDPLCRKRHDPILVSLRRDGVKADMLLRDAVFNRLVVPLLACTLLVSCLVQVLALRNDGWNGARLAPALSLFHVYNLYYGPENGPITGNIYGPIGSVPYLPAGMCTSPLSAITVASVISTILYFGPAAWLLCGIANGRTISLIALGIFVGVTFLSAPLRYCAFKVHADAPALGLASLSIACLALVEKRTIAYLAAAVFATLAFWAKLTTAGVLPALLLTVLMVDGRGEFVRFSVCALLMGIVVSLLVIVPWGIHELMFNVIAIPASIPWGPAGTWQPNSMLPEFYPDTMTTRLRAVIEAARDYCLNGILVIGFLLIGACGFGQLKKKGYTLARREKAASLACLLAFGLSAPLAIAGKAKVGGDVNNLSLSLYFGALLIALLAVILLNHAVTGRVLGLAGCATIVFLALGTWGPASDVLAKVSSNSEDRMDQAYRYARNHPGEAYFPWYPLSSLLGEGKMYHFAYGVFDRDLSGHRPTIEHFRSGIPDNVKYVCFEDSSSLIPESYFLSFLPDFRRTVELDELPGWRVYARE
jgi:hypothetical protein